MEGLTSQKWNTDEFEDWYHGDNVWIAFVVSLVKKNMFMRF